MNNKKLIKKKTEALVYQKIETALSDLPGAVNNKAFEKKLQKASSILAKDIAKAAKKDATKKAMAVTFLFNISKPGVCSMAVSDALSWKNEMPFNKIIMPNTTRSKVSHLGL